MGTCRNTGLAKTPGGRCADCQCGSSKIQLAQKPKREQPLWSINNTVETTVEPSSVDLVTSSVPAATALDPSAEQTGCEKSDAPGCQRAVCCQELKKDDKPSGLDPDLVRDIIIGLSDGLTVPFALTAGLSGTNSARFVVIAGLAELVSGAISMGVGGFLSAQAEVDYYRYRMRTTRQRLTSTCSAQIEREVYDVLGPYGVPAVEAGRVAQLLKRVEQEEANMEAQHALHHSRRSVTRRFRMLAHLPFLGTHFEKEANNEVETPPETESVHEKQEGLSVFLLRVGEGVEPVASKRMYISAIVIGLSYFLGGLIPLIPYFCTQDVYKALFISIGITGFVLFCFGLGKMKASGAPPDFRTYAFGAVSTLLVGAAAAAASFGIVRALEGDKNLG